MFKIIKFAIALSSIFSLYGNVQIGPLYLHNATNKIIYCIIISKIDLNNEQWIKVEKKLDSQEYAEIISSFQHNGISYWGNKIILGLSYLRGVDVDTQQETKISYQFSPMQDFEIIPGSYTISFDGDELTIETVEV
ncbi:MAG: hypothetical protein AB7R69_00040 [Candidatus Babeliales bacterium]